MKVLTYNTCWQARIVNKKTHLRGVVDSILKYSPDLILLQEIVFNKDVRIIDELFIKSGYNTVYYPKRVFNLGGLFVASKFLIIKSQFIPFEIQTPQQGLVSKVNTIMTLGFLHISVKISNGLLNCVNTHLHYPYFQPSIMNRHLDQVSQILKSVNASDPWIIGGDFNVTPKDIVKSTILGHGLIDASREIGNTYFPDRFPLPIGNKRLVHPKPIKFDYIFHSQNFIAKSRLLQFFRSKQDGSRKHYSDHDPILARLTMQEG